MKLLLILCFTTFTITSMAQRKKDFNNYYNKPLHIGIKGGANLVKLDGKGWSDGMKYGFHAGGFVQLKLKGRLQLQGEVLFSQMQADTAKELSDVFDFIRFSESRSTIKLNYLDIPIMLNIGIDQINAIKLQVGVQYGLLLNQNETVLVNGKNAFKSGNFSALAGFFWQLGPINLGARYLIGLDNINNVTNQSKWKTQTGQISIGFTL
jgi:hypothetical protein